MEVKLSVCLLLATAFILCIESINAFPQGDPTIFAEKPAEQSSAAQPKISNELPNQLPQSDGKQSSDGKLSEPGQKNQVASSPLADPLKKVKPSDDSVEKKPEQQLQQPNESNTAGKSSSVKEERKESSVEKPSGTDTVVEKLPEESPASAQKPAPSNENVERKSDESKVAVKSASSNADKGQENQQGSSILNESPKASNSSSDQLPQNGTNNGQLVNTNSTHNNNNQTSPGEDSIDVVVICIHCGTDDKDNGSGIDTELPLKLFDTIRKMQENIFDFPRLPLPKLLAPTRNHQRFPSFPMMSFPSLFGDDAFDW